MSAISDLCRKKAILFIGASILLLAPQANAMTINLSWDSSVTSNPNAAQIEAAITSSLLKNARFI
jgi:hypothetical protein